MSPERRERTSEREREYLASDVRVILILISTRSVVSFGAEEGLRVYHVV